MKVAMVSEHASPLAAIGGVDAGGQNVHVAALATALGAQGVHVLVHTRRDDPDLPRRVPLAPNVVVDHVDAGPPRPLPKDDLYRYMPAFGRDLARVWNAERPDVVHSHFWMSAVAALQAAVPLGIPVVQTFHALGVVKRRFQGPEDTSPRRRLAVEREIAARVDLILATCRDEVAELLDMGADPARIAIIPCGVDLGQFRPEGPSEPRPVDRDRLVVLGRLVPRKGVDDAIRALADIPRAELVVAGGPPRGALVDDPEYQRLLALADDLGVAERVDFRGSVARPAIPALLRSASVVVCAPWYEPFGIVPLEAMACGVPVVATSVGGLLDTVVDGVTGLHVPPRNPHALAAAVNTLLGSPELRAQLGRAGAARARRAYGWSTVAEQTRERYAQLVEPAELTERAALA